MLVLYKRQLVISFVQIMTDSRLLLLLLPFIVARRYECGYYKISKEKCEELGCIFLPYGSFSKCIFTTTPEDVLERNVIETPKTVSYFYVDAENGNDSWPGTENKPFKTILMSKIESKSHVFIKNGTYQNKNFGKGNNNGAVVSVQNKTDISFTPYPGHNPVIEFDGSAGFNLNNVTRIEISGFAIRGPNYSISKCEAEDDRLIKDPTLVNRFGTMKKLIAN